MMRAPATCARQLRSRASPSASMAGAYRGGGRGDEGPPGARPPPAQVGVLARRLEGGVVPAEGSEEVGAHQRAAAGGDEHVAHGVVLLLIDLARLHERRGDAGLVGG